MESLTGLKVGNGGFEVVPAPIGTSRRGGDRPGLEFRRPEITLGQIDPQRFRRNKHTSFVGIRYRPAIFPSLDGRRRTLQRTRQRSDAAELGNDGCNIAHGANVRYLRSLGKRNSRTDLRT